MAVCPSGTSPSTVGSGCSLPDEREIDTALVPSDGIEDGRVSEYYMGSKSLKY